MKRKVKDKFWKGVVAMRAVVAMPIIIAMLVFLMPVWAESSVLQEEAQGESQLPLVITQVQLESNAEEKVNDDDVLNDLEDFEEGEEASEEETVSMADPLQPWNRMWHHFNDKAYFWMFKPMAQGYSFVVPEGFRISFSNFYTNATAPVRIFNSLFQLKINYFFTEFGRFLINTTIGFVGFRDCAKDCFGIKPHDEDFGQTLGHYGVGHGIYLVWPLLGPSSVRDTIGKGADSILSFTGILSPVDLEVPVWVGLKAHEIVNEISLRIGVYEKIKEAAIDPYIAIRDGYAQRRKKAVQE
jgi:phospholipid-binding lipoprotein MlaA